MSDTEDSYCRLCAEPTPTDQLITTEEDVAISSMIVTKMLWINIDVSTSNNLPSSICFSCFDLLERTWNFLNNVRVAQEKLQKIFAPKLSEKSDTNIEEIKNKVSPKVGKPVDKDWEDFKNPKPEVKDDPDIANSQNQNADFLTAVKVEKLSDNEFGDGTAAANSDLNSTDSDEPLHKSVKKRKLRKKKKKIKYDPEISESDLLTEADAVPLDIALLSISWEDYMCRCATCDALCKNIASLRLHSIQIHSSCCIFKCPDCSKIISNFKTFISHARRHNKLLRYSCEFCNKQFNLTSLVKKHLQVDHGDEFINSCLNCGATFESQELLEEHLLVYSKSYKRKREKLNVDLKCEHCNKEFKSRSNLQQHKLVHTQRRRDFSCHVCGKMFFTKGTLSTHMSTHEDTKPFKCEFCPLAFRARGNLQSHISLHSGAKPFVCEQCGKSFRVKRHLKSHSIVHTDLMPFICQYCNKTFRFKTRLNLHIRQHTGAKPYTCVYCQRDFTNGSNYKKHMKRRHNIDTSKRKYNNVVVDNNDDVSSSHTN